MLDIDNTRTDGFKRKPNYLLLTGVSMMNIQPQPAQVSAMSAMSAMSANVENGLVSQVKLLMDEIDLSTDCKPR